MIRFENISKEFKGNGNVVHAIKNVSLEIKEGEIFGIIGFSGAGKKSILQLLKKLNQELGITIVIITHEMQVIKDICDRVAVMKDGEVVEYKDVFDVFANPKHYITKEFVDGTSNLSRIHDLIEEKSSIVNLAQGETILRFRYLERNVSEALVSQLSRKFNLNINIIFGNIELIGENPIGGLVSIVQGEKENIDQAISYLREKNVGDHHEKIEIL